MSQAALLDQETRLRPIIPAATRLRSMMFALCWIWIMGVAVLDSYLTIRYYDYMKEENPVGLLLMKTGGLSLFIAVKKLGTLLVAGILIWVYHSWPRRGIMIVAGLGFLQGVLLLYLFL
jgi:hypothetical protein